MPAQPGIDFYFAAWCSFWPLLGFASHAPGSSGVFAPHAGRAA